ncbi:opioid growth factor receptor-like protein 1 isoform X6 [Poecile atricapillus]|uniref:opioid growth factor receptor-like protein 1 isoform X6 n=1 Tax=Poecile atricapillus TaxID=48891 RepID=UPI002739FD6C|nr:opioid growth factor receptor-like protein 1 isoform X6 [Poecile atricapillus]XP_058690143.1 opioid growth factor receptor-like protein 1 isoform X6 [Poecile atricapillus]XP_058690144.1 opioid growth factor receptor-like protein 1 isoform X6 [Poecile atricapillus]
MSADGTELTAKPKRSFYAARDLYKYRHQYPQNFKDLRYQNDLCNLRFYKNKIPFKPDGVYIEEVLNKWKGDYEKLEHNHTYIQWLFPLREQGLNFYAKELTTYEIEEFKKTKEAIRRFLLAYKMMLEFFGIKLIDKTGNVARAANWQERFQHLNESQHNYLRITRILKSLGELGYESFKSPLVKFILHEALVEDTIPNIKQSALEYFVYTIRDRRERRKLLRFAQQHYTPSEHFIWGPPRKQKSEGSKANKKPASPVSIPNSHISKHKKQKEPKNTSASGSSAGKITEERKVEFTKNGEENDQDEQEVNCDAVRENSEKNSDNDTGQLSKSEEIHDNSDRKEDVSHSKKDDDSLNNDCGNHPGVTEEDKCNTENSSNDTSADLQDNLDKETFSEGTTTKAKDELKL